MQASDIKKLIEAGLPGAIVQIDGDGVHFEVVVASDQFAGKSLLQQQRIVYGTLGNRMQSEIHALSMKTYTKTEWEQLGSASAPQR
ncbi:MAG: bola family transcriptional regulator [Gammaproteobacteria bacterium]|nr:MAG: bola family transcriptional regulator [Gammaproteobacteria bacterium]TND06278.1 MAG: bola family transcriptional regulator [Gammaproteobacteria bacterium]